MMKKKLAKKFINLKTNFKNLKYKKLLQNFFAGAFLFFIFCDLTSCQSRSEKMYNQAYEKINQNQFKEAIDLLEASADLEKDNLKKTKALFEAARLLRFEIHNYEAALTTLRKIVLESEDAKLRLLSQESIAEIYFDHLQDYHSASSEFLILEPLLIEPKKK